MSATLYKSGVSSLNELHKPYAKIVTDHETLQPFIRQSSDRIYWLSRSRVDTRGHVLVVSIGHLPACAFTYKIKFKLQKIVIEDLV